MCSFNYSFDKVSSFIIIKSVAARVLARTPFPLTFCSTLDAHTAVDTNTTINPWQLSICEDLFRFYLFGGTK